MTKKILLIAPLALVLVLVNSLALTHRVAGSDSVKTEEQSDTAGEILIEHFIAEHDLDHAFVGVAVRDLESGKYLLSHNADRYFTPASNQKLLTTWAALKELGPDYNYETGFYVEAGSELDGAEIDSDLLVKGQGSPSFRPSELADRLSSEFGSSEKRFQGDLVIDVSEFDNTYFASGWMVEDENNYIGGLSVPLLSRILPSPEKDEYVEAIGQIIRSSLTSSGIKIEGRIKAGEVEDGWRKILAMKSSPLSSLLENMNRYSNNFTADMVFKSLATSEGQASFELAAELAQNHLEDAGVEERLRIVDGSGLSRYNMVRPAQIVKLLSYGFEHPRLEKENSYEFGELKEFYKDGSNVFTSTIARWGTGTMSSREGELDVRAKTGTLRDTSTLSGYLVTEKNSLLAFSIMINRAMDVGSSRSFQTELLKFLRDRQ